MKWNKTYRQLQRDYSLQMILALAVSVLLLWTCTTSMLSTLISPLALPQNASLTRSGDLQSATQIQVNAQGQTIDPKDGKCTLPEAILSANHRPLTGATMAGECVSGQDNNIITFNGLSTITLTTPYDSDSTYGPTGLPPITSTITIVGGVQGITIERSSESIELFRILRIGESNGRLTLDNVTIQGGRVKEDKAIPSHRITGMLIPKEYEVTIEDSFTDGGESETTLQKAGGSIFLHNQAALTLTNQSLVTGTRGGGIYGIHEVRVTLVDSMVSGGTGSGIAVRDHSHIVLMRSRVSNMVSSRSGGGLYAHNNSKIELTDSTIGHNRALNGGGIYVHYASDITLNNSDIISNTVGGDYGGGGGIMLDHFMFSQGRLAHAGNATIRNSRITHNRCEAVPHPDGLGLIQGDGGGFKHRGGNIFIVDSDISHNDCMHGGISGGGALTIKSSQISHNSSYALGVSHARVLDTLIHDNQEGGITSVGHLEVINSHIFSNTGPGIFAVLGEITVCNSSIVNNTNERGGGGGVYLSGSPRVVAQFINSRISHNIAKAYYPSESPSGGISASGTSIIIKNSELTHNQVLKSEEDSTIEARGGAISVRGGDIEISHSYIAHNSAVEQGGGIFVGPRGTVTLHESRLIQNQANEGGALQNMGMGGSVTMWNNVIMDNSHTAITGTGSIIATHNWWGQPDGPSGAGPGSGDSVGAGVDFSSFYTRPTINEMEFVCEEKTVFLPWVER